MKMLFNRKVPGRYLRGLSSTITSRFDYFAFTSSAFATAAYASFRT